MHSADTRFIKIIVDSEPGALAAVAQLLADAGINLEDMNALEFGGKALFLLSVSDEAQATAVLQDNGYYVLEAAGMIVKLENRPGTLAEVAGLLAENGININATTVIEKTDDEAHIALTVDDPAKAAEVLREFLL